MKKGSPHLHKGENIETSSQSITWTLVQEFTTYIRSSVSHKSTVQSEPPFGCLEKSIEPCTSNSHKTLSPYCRNNKIEEEGIVNMWSSHDLIVR